MLTACNSDYKILQWNQTFKTNTILHVADVRYSGFQTSFTTNAKRTPLDRKHKRRKDLQKQTQNQRVLTSSSVRRNWRLISESDDLVFTAYIIKRSSQNSVSFSHSLLIFFVVTIRSQVRLSTISKLQLIIIVKILGASEKKKKERKKMVIESYILIITLNVNKLNVPTKIHRWVVQSQKQDPYVCYLQETHFRPRDTYRLKKRGWKNHVNGNQKTLE